MVPTILIADADPELRGLYRRFFERHGWRAETTGGAVDCLEHLRRDAPHILILDSPLPWGGRDGLLAVMHEDCNLCRIPVILTSASPCDGTPTETSPPSVVGVLSKPFPLPRLLELARAAVEIRTGIAPSGAGTAGRETSGNDLIEPRTVTGEQLARIEEHVRCQLSGRVRDLRIEACGHGLVLWGYAHTYYAKQLAQQAVMEVTDLPIRANEIEVL